MKKIKFSEYPTYEENPFIPPKGADISFSKRYRPVLTPGCPKIALVTAVDGEGEVVGHTAFVRHDIVDEEKYIIIFINHCQSLFFLSNAGIRVMFYFFQIMRPNKDIVNFDVNECLSYTKFNSKATIYKGLAELLEAGVIARGKHNYLFFVNYHIAFNGDRVKFIYEMEKSQQTQANGQ